MGTGTRSLCISAFHFDGSFASQFTTIASGGSLIIFRREPMVLPRAFVRTVRDEQVTVVFCSPSFLRLLLTSRSIEDLADSSLVQIVFGGEASTERHLRQLFAALPRAHFYNQYGPTETVISVSLHEITMEQLESGDLPIGLPHPGVTFTLFDEHDHEVDQTDEAGELYVGGAQLMEGYWADPELSARVLRRDLAPPKVLYRTGDLVRRNAEGDFVYIGRADRVIKRTGMRISLDEIERNLRQLPGVTNAGCIAVASEDATKIVAYVAIEEGVTTLGLFAGLAKWLPRSMIPDTMCLVDSMPLTAAGKVDYRALTVIYGG
jgi:acyl-coenzyme A synthetase/AMP-(fatty) acid ligase